MNEICIRQFQDDDAEATAQIFFNSIRLGTRNYYNEAQRRAWAPQVPETSTWLGRLKSQMSLVAERDGRIIGFMTMECLLDG